MALIAFVALVSCSKGIPMPVPSDADGMIYGTKADELVFVKNNQALFQVYATTLWEGVSVERVEISARLTRPEASESEDYMASQTFRNVPSGSPASVTVEPGLYEDLTVKVTLSNGGVHSEKSSFSYCLPSQTYSDLIVVCDEAVCDLSNQETANCYLVRQPGRYEFTASVKGNGVSPDGTTSVITGIEGFKVICSTGGEFIRNCTISSGIISFETVNSGVLPAGNALLGVYSTADCKDGTCLWSWHIWCCPYVREVEIGSDIILDMPLGSLHRNYNFDAENGVTYQWGRKDPFIGKVFDVSATDEKATMAEAVANPTKFYVQSTAANWCKDNRCDFWCQGLTTNGNRSISIRKTMYDPCPPGYHVASFTCLSALISSYGEFSYETSGRVLSGIFFPYQGYLRYTDALLWQNGLMFNVWAATPYTDDSGYGIQCNYANTVHTFTAAKSFGNLIIAQKQ